MKRTADGLSTRKTLLKAIRWTTVLMVLLFSAAPALCAVSDYAGTYNGTFAGDDTGIWIALISSNGDVAFITWSNWWGMVDGTDNATINDSGNSSGTTEEGTFFSITVTLAGSVSGTWSEGLNDGTISGDKCDAATMSELAGTYSGSVYGDASGTFSFSVNSSGYVSGSVTVEGDKNSIEGGFDCDGNIILRADDASIKGTILSSGSISGNWYSDDGYSGGFSGSKTGDSTGDDGGGSSSSGPCFIQMIAE